MSKEDKQNSGSSSSQLNQFNSDQEVDNSSTQSLSKPTTPQTNLQLSASPTTATPTLALSSLYSESQMSSLSTSTSTTSSLSAPPKLGATVAA